MALAPAHMSGAAAGRDEARLAWLWLANALGPGAPGAGALLREFPSAAGLLQARFSQDLSGLLRPAQLRVLQHTEPAGFAPVLAQCAALDVELVCWDEEAYPPLLRQIPTPPPVLFYRGDISLAGPGRFTFAIVGTRRPSAYGAQATAKIAGELAAAGAVLVSGLADGLDGEGHRAALQAGAPTIACIAFGHDRCYPASNRQLKKQIEAQGLTMGEYPPGTAPQKNYFLQRNRLIAGLSRGVCVAEARRHSGTMNTVNQALEYGREVFSVPGSIFSPLCEGTNALLGEGARPATCGRDILDFYGLAPAGPAAPAPAQKQDRPPLSADARRLREALKFTPQGLDALCAATGLGAGQAMAGLLELELAGVCTQAPGRQFLLK